MVRKQLYITEAQDAALKRKALESGVSEAELVRRALDSELIAGRSGGSRGWLPGRTEAVASLKSLWSSGDYRVQGGFDRDELYAERLERNGE